MVANITKVAAVEKRKTIERVLSNTRIALRGAKMTVDFYNGYSMGYLDALRHNDLINQSQYNMLKRRCK